MTVFNLQKMNIHPCLGCLKGGKDPQSPCVQKDDMDKIFPMYEEADILVLASPMYYWSITAQLKAALDRLFAVAEKEGDYRKLKKSCVMLMAAEGDTKENLEPVEHYYQFSGMGKFRRSICWWSSEHRRHQRTSVTRKSPPIGNIYSITK